jgi:tripartite ATP-independent transporter DctM subunit
MSAELVVLVMCLLFALLLFTGYPVAFVLAGTATLIALAGEVLSRFGINIGVNVNYLGLVLNRIWGVMSDTGLVSVPLFIFMGYMLERSGIAEDLMQALQRVLARVPGGLALAVTLIGVVLAASTGVVGASLILLSTLALRPMLASGYRPYLATGTIMASGCLGILIPPSIMLIVMAEQLVLPVGDLFMAAVFPGLLLGALYAVYIFVHAWLRPQDAPPFARPQDEAVRSAWQSALYLLRALVPPVLLILAVLGSIFFGIATPSEAAGVGALGATVLAAANGKFSLAALREVSETTARTTGFVFAIFLGATCFSVVLVGVNGDRVIGNALTGLSTNPGTVVLFLLFIIFLLGFFLEWIEITLIVLPLIRPVLVNLGIDPVWFAILMAVVLQTAFLSPPVGAALFYVKALSPPGVTLGQIYRGTIPFIAMQLVGAFMVFLWPWLATWLPKLVYAPVK